MKHQYLWLIAVIIIILYFCSKTEGFDQLVPDKYVNSPRYHLNQRIDGEFPDISIPTTPTIVPSKYHPSHLLESVVDNPYHPSHLSDNIDYDPPLQQMQIKPFGKIIDGDNFPQGKSRPYNDFNQRLSYTELASSDDVDQSFDNSYFQLYGTEEEHGLKRKQEIIKKMKEKGVDTYPYDKVNECFSKCSKDKQCYGVDTGNGKCTLIRHPPYSFERHNFNKNINNDPYEVYQTFNRTRKPYGNEFYYYGNDRGNDSYGGAISQEQCLQLCPKCKLGKCPENYRCVNVRTDPKNGINCVITNRNSYDEKTGNIYDNPSQIPITK